MSKKKSDKEEIRTPLKQKNIFVFGSSAQVTEFELMLSPRFNFNQKHLIREVSSPRDADVLMIFGALSLKSAPVLRRVYDQMNSPKWVVAVGGSANDSYSLVDDLNKIVPIDLYLNKVSPSPVDIWNALEELN